MLQHEGPYEVEEDQVTLIALTGSILLQLDAPVLFPLRFDACQIEMKTIL